MINVPPKKLEKLDSLDKKAFEIRKACHLVPESSKA
jgi:hypothetical protein